MHNKSTYRPPNFPNSKIDPYPTGGRGSGRTTWMIRRIVDQIEEIENNKNEPNEPDKECLVFAHSYNFAIDYLLPKIMNELSRRRIPFRHNNQNEIKCPKSKIIFFSVKDDYAMKQLKYQYQRYSCFIDHFALDTYSNLCYEKKWTKYLYGKPKLNEKYS
jgi:hypothetical protein